MAIAHTEDAPLWAAAGIHTPPIVFFGFRVRSLFFRGPGMNDYCLLLLRHTRNVPFGARDHDVVGLDKTCATLSLLPACITSVSSTVIHCRPGAADTSIDY